MFSLTRPGCQLLPCSPPDLSVQSAWGGLGLPQSPGGVLSFTPPCAAGHWTALPPFGSGSPLSDPRQLPPPRAAGDHGMVGWEGTLQPIQCHPCHGHLPLSQAAPNPVQPGLGHCQGSRGSHSCSGHLCQDLPTSE
uniref:Uncharacterized protein n=1 Tax=Geospiza parvula TaxID=87175 RepID=A0A8C3MY37_GEOPR